MEVGLVIISHTVKDASEWKWNTVICLINGIVKPMEEILKMSYYISLILIIIIKVCGNKMYENCLLNTINFNGYKK